MDLTKLTLEKLRELAKTHLKKGYSKLSKTELVRKLGPFLEPARPAPERSEVEEIEARAEVATLEVPVRPEVPSAADESPRVRSNGGTPAEVFHFASTPRKAPEPAPASEPVSQPASAPASEPAPVVDTEPHFAEPLSEGFFVARMAGEGEARRHHMLEALAPAPHEAVGPGHDEGLGELPSHPHGDDRTVLLPRDPWTLFAFWGFRSETIARAAEGLDDAAAGAPRLRRAGVPPAGRDRAADERLLPPLARERAGLPGRGPPRRPGREVAPARSSSNRVLLPPFGPSENTEVRFMRIPPTVPVEQLPVAIEAGAVQVRGEPAGLPTPGAVPHVRWRRTELPNSASLLEREEFLSGLDDVSALGPGFVRPAAGAGVSLRSGARRPSSSWTSPRSGRPY